MTATLGRPRTQTAGLLQDKIVIITGAGSGIGAASARLFGREGATVVLAGLQEDELEEVTASVVDSGGQADWVRADVSVPDDIERLVPNTVQRHGRLDGAFNNAGLSQGGALLGDLDADRFDDVLSVNVKGVWLCMRAEIAAMTSGGGGSIVNASSIAGLRGPGPRHLRRQQARRRRPDPQRRPRLRAGRDPRQRAGTRHRRDPDDRRVDGTAAGAGGTTDSRDAAGPQRPP